MTFNHVSRQFWKEIAPNLLNTKFGQIIFFENDLMSILKK